MSNTLGLDDDLDSVELIQDLEASFAVKFTKTEAESCLTVGDVFALLTARFSTDDVSNQGCASAIAFYRLRRAFNDAGVERHMAPATRLDELSSLPPKLLVRKLRSHTSLRLPRMRLGRNWVAGVVLITLSIFSFMVFAVTSPQLLLLSLAFLLVGIMLLRFDRGEFPDGCNTLGDLARKVAGNCSGCQREGRTVKG